MKKIKKIKKLNIQKIKIKIKYSKDKNKNNKIELENNTCTHVHSLCVHKTVHCTPKVVTYILLLHLCSVSGQCTTPHTHIHACTQADHDRSCRSWWRRIVIFPLLIISQNSMSPLYYIPYFYGCYFMSIIATLEKCTLNEKEVKK